MNIHELLAIDTATTTARVELGNDPKTEQPYGLLVVGLDSPQYRAETDRQRFEGMADRRELNKEGGKKLDPETPEGFAVFQKKFQANLLGTAKAVTVGWFGFTDKAGRPVEFDPAVAAQMLEARTTWRDKVLAKIEQDAAFLPQPQKDSEPTADNMPGSSPTAKTKRVNLSDGAPKS